jgi:hypothetical protein
MLDACALLALLNNEPGISVVKDLLMQANAEGFTPVGENPPVLSMRLSYIYLPFYSAQ